MESSGQEMRKGRMRDGVYACESEKICCFRWPWISHRGNIIICVPDVPSCLFPGETLRAGSERVYHLLEFILS